jgi:SAM-dependent methyltransferase
VLACDLCQNSQFELIGTKDRRGRSLRTCVCRTCGLVSHATIPSQPELDEFYREHYRRELHGRPQPSAYRVLRDWRRARAILGPILPFLQPGDRILDVGAGTGCIARQLDLLGYETRGIEPSPWYARFARQQLGAPVSNGTLDAVTAATEYDVVLLIHVLEHLRSPAETLRRIHGWLCPGGRLVIDVPNLATPHASRSRLFHFSHIFNFTHITLEGLARRCGFQLIQRLTGAEDPNLRIVLGKADERTSTIPAEGYAVTMDALRRSHPARYYARWTYYRERIMGAIGRTQDRLAAAYRLHNLQRQLAVAVKGEGSRSRVRTNLVGSRSEGAA